MDNVEKRFQMCCDCSHKEKRDLGKGIYYCRFVDGTIPKGIVTVDTDASQCVYKGFFRPITPNRF